MSKWGILKSLVEKVVSIKDKFDNENEIDKGVLLAFDWLLDVINDLERDEFCE